MLFQKQPVFDVFNSLHTGITQANLQRN